jgi:hypothetical protein
MPWLDLNSEWNEKFENAANLFNFVKQNNKPDKIKRDKKQSRAIGSLK